MARDDTDHDDDLMPDTDVWNAEREAANDEMRAWILDGLRKEPESPDPVTARPASDTNGLVIEFDPMLFCRALEAVIIPGTSSKPTSRHGKLEIAVFPTSLRIRSHTPHITCEVELAVKHPLEGLPQEGIAFTLQAYRLQPFFSVTTFKRTGGELRQRKRWEPTGFEKFEYLRDEGTLVLARASGRFQFAADSVDPSPSLSCDGPGEAVDLLAVHILEQAVRQAAFVIRKSATKPRDVAAIFQNGECTAVSLSRAVSFASTKLNTADMTMPLGTPLKLAAMLRRLRDSVRMTVKDDFAVLDDGFLRCAFPVKQSRIPQIDAHKHKADSSNSAAFVNRVDLAYLFSVFSIIAGNESNITLTVRDTNNGTILHAEMREAGESCTHSFSIEACERTPGSETPVYREVRVSFSDLAAALEQLNGDRQSIAFGSKTLQITDLGDDFECTYFIGRNDLHQKDS